MEASHDDTSILGVCVACSLSRDTYSLLDHALICNRAISKNETKPNSRNKNHTAQWRDDDDDNNNVNGLASALTSVAHSTRLNVSGFVHLWIRVMSGYVCVHMCVCKHHTHARHP